MQIALILYIYGTQPFTHSFIYSTVSTPMYKALSDMSSQLTSGVWGEGHTFGQLEFKGVWLCSLLVSLLWTPSMIFLLLKFHQFLSLLCFFSTSSFSNLLHIIKLHWAGGPPRCHLIRTPIKPLSNLHSLCVLHLHFIPQPMTTHPPTSVITVLSKVTCCCCCSVTQLRPTLWPRGLQDARPPCPSPSSQSLPKFMTTASVMPSSHLTLRLPLLLLPSISPSIRDLASGLALCIRWPKEWSFSFCISPSNEYSGLISLKIDWLDLPAAQGILRSLLQHHSLKASVFWCSASFTILLSPPCLTAGKTRALMIQTFVGRVIPLLFNPCLVCHKFPAKKQSSSDLMAAVTICCHFRAQEEETCHYFHHFPFYLPWNNGTGCQDLSF